MRHSKGYPILQIDKHGIYNNAKRILEICRENEIAVAGVIKGVNGMLEIAEEMVRAGCSQLASSRLQQLAAVKGHMPQVSTMLLRIPMASEVDDLVEYADYSLNSEWEIIEQIEDCCKRRNRQHGVILMADLGDLREGFFDPSELIRNAIRIEKEMTHVKLAGVGTNLGCYGSIKPTEQNMGQLAQLAGVIEQQIGRKLEFVSGGATPSMKLVAEGRMPKGINHLRIGEAILLDMDLPRLWHVELGGMSSDTFVLKAEIVEIKNKPSFPIGERFVDAFGRMPEYEDRGVRKRALLAVGKQDFAMENLLLPLDEKAEILGSSSDHLIVDIENCEKEYMLGDIMEFRMFYGPMLYLCCSEWVAKELV